MLSVWLYQTTAQLRAVCVCLCVSWRVFWLLFFSFSFSFYRLMNGNWLSLAFPMHSLILFGFVCSWNGVGSKYVTKHIANNLHICVCVSVNVSVSTSKSQCKMPMWLFLLTNDNVIKWKHKKVRMNFVCTLNATVNERHWFLFFWLHDKMDFCRDKMDLLYHFE